MKIKNYVKKPVIIQAVQWDGTEESLRDVEELASGNKVTKIGRILYIGTEEGLMEVWLGHFVIKGIAGEIYPCKPDIFYKIYEEIKGDIK